MKPLGLLAWPFLVCYILLAFTVLAKDSDNVPLKVSIRKDALQGAPSCQHTFGQIELLNSHHSEHIMIYSIQTSPEESKLVRSVSGGSGNNSSWESIPQQLHVSRLPSGSLSLGPGQVAIVPLTYLPRYPELEHDNLFFTGEIKESPTITPAARRDLEDLLGVEALAAIEKSRRKFDPTSMPPRRRNNLEPSALPSVDEFRVSTSIMVETSKGMLTTPITATSSRQNVYAIPDVIRFHHSTPPEATSDEKDSTSKPIESSRSNAGTPLSVMIMRSVRFEEPTVVSSEGHAKAHRSSHPRDCYDVYLNNPLTDRELEVSEVLISRPELMSVEFDPNRLPFPPDVVVIPSEPSQVIRKWTDEGPMYLSPDSTDNYVATVCTAPVGVDLDEPAVAYLEEMNNWIDSGSPDVSLGFMQIRTETETLFIALERYSDRDEETFEGIDSMAMVTDGTVEPAVPASKLLKASTDNLNFRLISSSSPPSVAAIGLHNKSPAPIRIMRVSVGMNTLEDPSLIEKAKLLGLEFTVARKSTDELDSDSQCNRLESLLLPAASTVDEALVVSCQTVGNPNWLALHEESFQFTGAIVIRGTMDTELSHEQWEAEMIYDPFRDIHVTIEIPYKVVVLNGRVEVTLERSTHPYPQIFASQSWDNYGRAVATLFFPEKAFDSTEDSEAPLPTQLYRNSREIGHDLRVMSNLALPIQVDYTEIVDEQGSAEFGKGSMCARFNVSRARAFEPDMAYPEFDDLEFISLQYKFRPQREKAGISTHDTNRTLGEPLLPTTCYLQIVTSPKETGSHRIPLIIFPAELEASALSHFGEKTPQSDASGHWHPRPVSTGYDNLLAWFKSTLVGRSLLETLSGAGTDGKKNQQSWTNILSSYVRKLCQSVPERERQRLNPILLRIGAIEHSEIARAPLFFTNHNPIPITLTINVGEVEGMSISLGRDESQGRGDGNSLLDYLPNIFDDESQETDVLVGEGNFRGHPVHGLRQFLVSNAEALGFSDRFPFRDAISLNQGAVSKQPLLTQLYKWHSYAEFHRSGIFPDLSTNQSSHCDLSSHPPPYSSAPMPEDDHRQQRFLGAVMISGDKQLTRPLEICSQSSTKSHSLPDGSRILIPPGGTARFEVAVRSPPEPLLNSDISQLLATGLVLSTNLGEAMPIFASFEALQGHLFLVNEEDATEMKSDTALPQDKLNMSVVDVPMDFNWEPETPYMKKITEQMARSQRVIKLESNGVDIHLGSSFSRDIRILDVNSCSNMFHVAMEADVKGVDMTPGRATKVGSLRGVAPCIVDSEEKVPFPSFYQCALNWLSRRQKIESPDCLVPHLPNHNTLEAGKVELSQRGTRNVIEDLGNALLAARVLASDRMDNDPNGTAIQDAFFPHDTITYAIKSGRRRRSGFMDLESLKIFAKAANSWRKAKSMGLTTISSRLRADLEYDASPGKPEDANPIDSQRLSISMHNVVAQASLGSPKLFAGRSASDGKTVNSLDFPPTRVGDVVSMMVPLYNPTSVPVRVRLSAAPSDSANDDLHDFLLSTTEPFIQRYLGSNPQRTFAHDLWWDGGGSFWLPDAGGDILRSHHNITIRAGPGAHVSLINPSLQSINSFTLGCGLRCGLREETKSQETDYDPRQGSVIGAAAAAGISLNGRKRDRIAEMNELSGEEPFLIAGGMPLPDTGGPSAFAIPISGLDEIVLPPYGVGKLGPVFFRPPGRHGAVGCQLAQDSGANHWSEKMKRLCEAKEFESMLLLENTLTGVERILLRGKSQWDHLYFLDPPPEDGANAYGDIELRNGQSTLFFSGSGTRLPKRDGRRKVVPVVKQVVLHNGGDSLVEISSVYLSDSRLIANPNQRPKQRSQRSCKVGSFQLMDCWESSLETYRVDRARVSNNFVGFALQPGESRPLFVEHFADCSRQQEFISLNVDVLRRKRQHVLQNHIRAQDAVQLMVGYHMNHAQYDKCAPVNWGGADFIVSEAIGSSESDMRNATRQRKLGRGIDSSTDALTRKSLPLFSFLALCSIAIVLLFYSGQSQRNSLERMTSKERVPSTKDDSRQPERRRLTQKNLWNAAYRCLARADPNSSELQTLGREQIRQVIVGRYRSKGALPPQSMSTNGTFSRDRPRTASNSGSRPRGGNETTGSNRIRTLSDALFQNLHGDRDGNVRDFVPSGLGWKVAISQGIIEDHSVAVNSIAKRSRDYKSQGRNSREEEAPNLTVEFQTGGSIAKKQEHDAAEKPERKSVKNISGAEDSTNHSDDDGSWDSVPKNSQASSSRGVRKGAASKEGKNSEEKREKTERKDVSSSPRQAEASQLSKSNGNDAFDKSKSKANMSKVASKLDKNTMAGTKSSGGQAKSQLAAKDGQLSHQRKQPNATGRKDKTPTNLQEKETAWEKPALASSSNTKGKGSTGSQQKGKGSDSKKSDLSGNKNERKKKKDGSTQGSKQSGSAKRGENKSKKGGTRAEPKVQAVEKEVLPPPGLAPPPGFNRDEGADTLPQQSLDLSLPVANTHENASLGDMLTAALNSDMQNNPTPASLPFSRSELFFSGGLGEGQTTTPTAESGELSFRMPSSSDLNAMVGTGRLPTEGNAGEEAVPPPSDPVLDNLLSTRDNSHKGFDVMDFLDSILDDGKAAPEATEAPSDDATGLPPGTDQQVSSSNPWASERKSRASAYGISFDETDETGAPSFPLEPLATDGEGSGLPVAPIPLLTPAAILLSQQEDDVDEDDRALSFYTSLIDD